MYVPDHNGARRAEGRTCTSGNGDNGNCTEQRAAGGHNRQEAEDGGKITHRGDDAPLRAADALVRDVLNPRRIAIIFEVSCGLAVVAELFPYGLLVVQHAQFGVVEATGQELVDGRVTGLCVMEDSDRFCESCIILLFLHSLISSG